MILPSHYRKTAIVSWIVDPRIKDAEFYVYRKVDGGATWELLNEEPVFGTTFTDTKFVITNKVQQPAYKVLALHTKDGKTLEYISPEVALFSKTGRKAFGVAHNIIRAKYLQARADGIPVLYYPLIKNGEKTATLDSITGQRTKADCGADGGDEPDYGTYYKGGFYPPFLTYIRLLGERIQRTTVLDTGVVDSTSMNAELLAFPPVRTGDMIVDVATDRRWLVGDNIRTDMVKGVIPVGYEAQIVQQAHNAPCYAVPVPSNYSEMLYKLEWPTL